MFAWGGPVAQIALIKEQSVMKRKWITIARFNDSIELSPVTRFYLVLKRRNSACFSAVCPAVVWVA